MTQEKPLEFPMYEEENLLVSAGPLFFRLNYYTDKVGDNRVINKKRAGRGWLRGEGTINVKAISDLKKWLNSKEVTHWLRFMYDLEKKEMKEKYEDY